MAAGCVYVRWLEGWEAEGLGTGRWQEWKLEDHLGGSCCIQMGESSELNANLGQEGVKEECFWVGFTLWA